MKLPAHKLEQIKIKELEPAFIVHKFQEPVSMTYSIVLPSNRFEWVQIMLKSIFSTAAVKDKVEVLIAVNLEDPRTQASIQKYQKKHPKRNVHMYPCDHKLFAFSPKTTFPGIVGYVNWLSYTYSKGKYIIPMNDDALFVSKDWDTQTDNRLSNYLSANNFTDGAVLGVTEDSIYHSHGFNGTKAPISSFPVISRKGAELLGYVFSPEFFHNTADGHVTYTYWQMNRAVDCKDIFKINHRPPELTGYVYNPEDVF